MRPAPPPLSACRRAREENGENLGSHGRTGGGRRGRRHASTMHRTLRRPSFRRAIASPSDERGGREGILEGGRFMHLT